MIKIIEIIILSFIGATGLTMLSYALNPNIRGRIDPVIGYKLKKQTTITAILSYIVCIIINTSIVVLLK